VRGRLLALGRAHELTKAALTLPVGQISITESRALGSLVAGLSTPGPIIEIGTLFGWSTRVMTLFKDPARELITVDSYAWNPLSLPRDEHRQSTATALAEAATVHKVRVVDQDKAGFYASYQGPAPALVFLDAIHSYEETKKDIEWARRVGAGVVCVHDYSSVHPGVVRAVDEAGGPAALHGTLAVLH